MDFFSTLNPVILNKILISVGVIFTLTLLRFWFLNRFEKQTEQQESTLLLWNLRAKQAYLAIIFIVLVVVWAPQIQSFALSAVAIAVAIVIATKELITCMTGAMVRSSADEITIGSRIEIKGVKGDVIDYSLLTTTLIEVNEHDQRTGRAVILPNSVFIGESIYSEITPRKRYVYLIVPFKLNPEKQDWQKFEKKLLKTSQAICEPYIKQATTHLKKLNRKYGLTPPIPEPTIILDNTDVDKMTISVRFAAPVDEQIDIKQRLIREMLS